MNICHAADNSQNIEEKIYLQAEQVYIVDDCILVDLEGDFVGVDALFVDSIGIFIPSIKAVGPYKCPRCHRWNSPWTKCVYCGWPD